MLEFERVGGIVDRIIDRLSKRRTFILVLMYAGAVLGAFLTIVSALSRSG